MDVSLALVFPWGRIGDKSLTVCGFGHVYGSPGHNVPCLHIHSNDRLRIEKRISNEIRKHAYSRLSKDTSNEPVNERRLQIRLFSPNMAFNHLISVVFMLILLLSYTFFVCL